MTAETEQWNVLFSWSEHEIWKEKPDYYDQNNDEYADDVEFLWNDMLKDFNEAMERVSKGTDYWQVNVSNHGWMHQTGHKFVEIETAKDEAALQMIQQTLPRDSDVTFTVYTGKAEYLGQEREVLRMLASHHDAHGEEYLLIPLSSEERDEEN
jgi:hypothetical protein